MQDPAKTEKVGREWEKKNPCVIKDSTVKYLPGRVDSITIVLPVVDTTRLKHVKDSVRRVMKEKYAADQSDCDRQVNEAYDVGYKQARYELSLRKIADKKPDTIVKLVEDIRRLNIAKDSIFYYSGKTNQLNNQVKQLRSDIKEWRHLKRKWFWMFWTLLAVVGLKYFVKYRYKIAWL